MEGIMETNKMETRDIFPLLMSMSLPMVLSMLVQSLYNIIDSIYVSYLGTGLSRQCHWHSRCRISCCLWQSESVSGLLPSYRSVWEKRIRNGQMRLPQWDALTLIHCVLFVILGLVITEPFIGLFTKEPEVMKQACDYTYIVLCFSFGSLLQIAMEKIYQGIGAMKTTMILLGAGAMINIILDPILIFGLLGFPEMGVKGAAVATVIGQISAFLLYIVVYLRKNPGVTIHPKYLHLDWQLIRQIYSVGIPSSLMMTMPSVLVGGLNGILAAFSDTYVAVLGIYFKLQTFIYMPANGIVQGMRPIIGYNYGAGSKKRVRDTIRYSLISAAVLMLVGTVVSLAIPDIILSMFQADAELMRAGTEALRLISLGFLVSSAGVIFSGVFEALGRGGDSLIISLLRQLVIILPLGYLLSRTMGAAGIWISFPVAELVSAVIACLLLKRMEGGIYFPFDKKEIINRK